MVLKTQKFLVKFKTTEEKLMDAIFNLDKDILFFSEEYLLSMIRIPSVKIISSEKK